MTEEELEREVAILAEGRTWCIHKTKWHRPGEDKVELGFQISIWKPGENSLWQNYFSGYEVTAEQALEQIMDMVTAPGQDLGTDAAPGPGAQPAHDDIPF